MGWRALNKFDSDALRWCYVMKKLLKDLLLFSTFQLRPVDRTATALLKPRLCRPFIA